MRLVVVLPRGRVVDGILQEMTGPDSNLYSWQFFIIRLLMLTLSIKYHDASVRDHFIENAFFYSSDEQEYPEFTKKCVRTNATTTLNQGHV